MIRWRFNRFLRARVFLSGLALAAVLVALSAGCSQVATDPGETGPTTVAALPADRQDDSIRPTVVWLPRDDSLALWGSFAGVSGWAGVGQSYVPGQDIHARVDFYRPDGRLAWSWQRPRTDGESCYMSAATLSDGTLLAGGRLVSGTDPEIALLTALDARGDVVWETVLDYPADPNVGLSFLRLAVTSGDRIYAAGWTTRYNETGDSTEAPVVIACYDSAGQPVWQKTFEFGGQFTCSALCPAGDEGVYLAVYGYSRQASGHGEEKSWLLRLDDTGREIWRQPLQDEQFDYEGISLATDGSGQVLIACSARGRDTAPTPIPSPAVFHDRFRAYAANPAALLCYSQAGELVWNRLLNGAFGAQSRQVYCEGEAIYWLVRVIDDVVPPYIFMSLDHRTLAHDVLAVLEKSSADLKIWQFARDQSSDQLICRTDNGQAAMIGIAPFIPPPEWETETFIPG